MRKSRKQGRSSFLETLVDWWMGGFIHVKGGGEACETAMVNMRGTPGVVTLPIFAGCEVRSITASVVALLREIMEQARLRGLRMLHYIFEIVIFVIDNASSGKIVTCSCNKCSGVDD